MKEYWKNPQHKNSPQMYIGHTKRSEFLLNNLPKLSKRSKIIEIGCNVGRNLDYLFNNGYKKLTGIELNENAVKLMAKTYKEMYQKSNIITGDIEIEVDKFKNNEFDLLFSMAVMEHLDYSFDFRPLVRIAKCILTIEDERYKSKRHYPRNYKDVFENLGMTQVYQSGCSEAGLSNNFILRVFTKPTNKWNN